MRNIIITLLTLLITAMSSGGNVNVADISSANASFIPTVRAEMTEHDNSLYYVSNGNVYKHCSDGDLLVIDDGSIARITSENDCMFYLTADENIYKTDFDGNSPTLIWSYATCGYDRFFGVTSIQAYRDVIYIFNGVNNVLAYDLNNGTTKEFAVDVSSAAFAGDYMYYTDHAMRTFSIFRKNLETGETELVRGDGETFENSKEDMYDEVMSVNGELYYTMRFPVRLCKFNPDGEDELLLSADDTMSVNYVSGSDIFCAYSVGDKVKLHKYSSINNTVEEYEVDGFSLGKGYCVLNNTLFYLTDEGVRQISLSK